MKMSRPHKAHIRLLRDDFAGCDFGRLDHLPRGLDHLARGLDHFARGLDDRAIAEPAGDVAAGGHEGEGDDEPDHTAAALPRLATVSFPPWSHMRTTRAIAIRTTPSKISPARENQF